MKNNSKRNFTLNVYLIILKRFQFFKHALTFLLKNYPEYKQYLGETPLERDGSICRLPTEEERVMGLGLVF